MAGVPEAHTNTLLRLELRAARREIERLKEGAWGSAEADGFEAQLPRLLQLCHPDRHGGSKAANLATSWLLKARERLSGVGQR